MSVVSSYRISNTSIWQWSIPIFVFQINCLASNVNIPILYVPHFRQWIGYEGIWSDLLIHALKLIFHHKNIFQRLKHTWKKLSSNREKLLHSRSTPWHSAHSDYSLHYLNSLHNQGWALRFILSYRILK